MTRGPLPFKRVAIGGSSCWPANPGGCGICWGPSVICNQCSIESINCVTMVYYTFGWSTCPVRRAGSKLRCVQWVADDCQHLINKTWEIHKATVASYCSQTLPEQAAPRYMNRVSSIHAMFAPSCRFLTILFVFLTCFAEETHRKLNEKPREHLGNPWEFLWFCWGYLFLFIEGRAGGWQTGGSATWVLPLVDIAKILVNRGWLD